MSYFLGLLRGGRRKREPEQANCRVDLDYLRQSHIIEAILARLSGRPQLMWNGVFSHAACVAHCASDSSESRSGEGPRLIVTSENVKSRGEDATGR